MKKNMMTITQAISGYTLACEARQLSKHTIAAYANTFKKFVAFVGEGAVFVEIDRGVIRQFLAGQEDVSKKTVLNYHTSLAALWTWAVEEGLSDVHVVHQVKKPKPEKREIMPLTEQDVKLLLEGVKASRVYTRPGKRPSQNERPEADRDRAILLLLLDTGLRASELCDLKVHNLDMKNKRLKVFGKGAQERFLPFSAKTAQALWKYLSNRANEMVDEPLFKTKTNNPLDRCQLLHLLDRLGKRMGVQNVHPHRFRHTFALFYLRHGGDPWSLQKMLGHESMDMVKVYVQLAQSDLDAAHKRASPVENMRL